MRRLLGYAEKLGVRVSPASLWPGVLGCYVKSRHHIYLDLGLTPVEQKSVLAHELGHAYYGHGAPGTPQEEQAQERKADLFAARLLIDHRRYADAERLSRHPEDLAEELGVTVDLVRVYQQGFLQRGEHGAFILESAFTRAAS